MNWQANLKTIQGISHEPKSKTGSSEKSCDYVLSNISYQGEELFQLWDRDLSGMMKIKFCGTEWGPYSLMQMNRRTVYCYNQKTCMVRVQEITQRNIHCTVVETDDPERGYFLTVVQYAAQYLIVTRDKMKKMEKQ